MRKALNENPTVQLVVLAIAGVVFAFILFTTVLKKDDTATTGSTDPAAATTATDGSATTATTPDASASTGSASTGGASATPSTPSTPAPSTTPPATGGAAGTADGLLPTKGLPEDLLVAYAKNKAIALLVIDPQSLGSTKLRKATDKLRSRNDVEVFIVKTKDIARYSRITQGVSVSQAPALVVIRPRKLTDSVPTATISYGIRGPKSVAQAIDDALYKGGPVPAYP